MLDGKIFSLSPIFYLRKIYIKLSQLISQEVD